MYVIKFVTKFHIYLINITQTSERVTNKYEAYATLISREPNYDLHFHHIFIFASNRVFARALSYSSRIPSPRGRRPHTLSGGDPLQNNYTSLIRQLYI